MQFPGEAGFNWGSASIGAAILGIVGLIIRQIGPWRRQLDEASQQLIKSLADRLDKVERTLTTERRLHYIETARREARHAAQRSLDRHKFNNSEACFDGLLRVLELSPEKASDAAKQAREQRARQRESETLEQATIHAAEIAAVERAEAELMAQELIE